MRGLDHAQRTVGELDRGHRHVLDRDPLVGQQAVFARTSTTGPISQVEQIDAVDGLVHQGPAAVEFPGAAPRAAVVIGLAAKPLHVGVAQREPAEPPAVDGPLQFAGWSRETARGRSWRA